jgi:hypothetical protein
MRYRSLATGAIITVSEGSPLRPLFDASSLYTLIGGSNPTPPETADIQPPVSETEGSESVPPVMDETRSRHHRTTASEI